VSIRLRRRARAQALAIAGICVVIGCAPSVEEDAWVLPRPPGLSVRTIAESTGAVRSAQEIEVVEDLVIGAAAPPAESLFTTNSIAVASDGRIYVKDVPEHQIRVYDPAGHLLSVFGGPGQGPGELLAASSIAIAGNHVVVQDTSKGKIIRWTLDGDFVDELPIPAVEGTSFLGEYQPAGDESLLTYHTSRVDVGSYRRTYYRTWLTKDAIHGFGSVSVMSPFLRLDDFNFLVPVPDEYPDASYGVDLERSTLYLAAGNLYQVLAINLDDGTARWAVEKPSLERPISKRARRDAALRSEEMIRARFRRDVTVSPEMIEWPSAAGAIRALRVDGHGHVYVFGVANEAARPGQGPVDVYAPDGALLFTGQMTFMRFWTAAHENFVYTFEMADGGQAGEVVVRYKLKEPF